MTQLTETKIDQSKMYFHGSSEDRVSKLEPPSVEHPFYVTSDLHYAMAFCTKDESQTGDYGYEKTFTPASQNFVYAVSLNPSCRAFDFRDHDSSEFKKLYKVIDQDLVQWVELQNARGFDLSDIFEFVVALRESALKPVIMSNFNYLEYGRLFGDQEDIMSPKLFLKACAFVKSNNLVSSFDDCSIHKTMAPILKGLQKQGFHAVLTRETDFNDEDKDGPSKKVSTSYALGIFDKAGLDLVGLVPMRYTWLKRINPTYLQDKTEASANKKIQRFIKLYKRITAQKNIDESALESEETWYFGNNRSKMLQIAKPSWDAPFFLATSYEYAEDYADYGVYKLELANERNPNILDFSNEEEVQKLGWPEVLVDKILDDKNDLNGLAYDLYLLASGNVDDLMYIQNDDEWLDAALYFQDKSRGIFQIANKRGIWGSEKDHQLLLQMWKDIYDAGFDGFTYLEFGNKVLALFDLKCIGKISAAPIQKPLVEAYDPPYTLSQIKDKYPEDIYVELSQCPIHSWRAKTGVELIHQEPTEEELDRIWNNWQLMSQELKDISDQKSIELFGCTNAENYIKLKSEWQSQRLAETESQVAMFIVDIPLPMFKKVLKHSEVTNKHFSINQFEKLYDSGMAWHMLCDASTKQCLAAAAVAEDYGPTKGFAYVNELQSLRSGGGYGKKLLLELKKYYKTIWLVADVSVKGDSLLKFYRDPDFNLSEYVLQAADSCYEVDTHFFASEIRMHSSKWIAYLKQQFGKDLASNEDKRSQSLLENKATYLKQFQDEPDVHQVVDKFWSIRNRMKAPQNDIDWWIKKPYPDFKNFVMSFDTRNKSEKRQENWKQEALKNNAKLLGTKDGYEMWYAPTYDSMRILGRFYKGRSAKWCVASDDPDFWFDNHEDSEFMVLIRENPHDDEFDKVAIEMMNHGRYYNDDDIIPWDLENEDRTFTNDDLMYEAWVLFKDNGETREQYFG